MKKVILFIVAVVLLTASGYMVLTDFLPKKEIPIKEEPIVKEPVVIPTLKILDLDSKTRPIAVMINNHDEARPYQSGLNDAYIVYEIIVEGGITRLMAVYKDETTTRIGSVRSSRHYYLDYVLENDAIYVHFGYSPQALSDMNSLRIAHIDGMSYGGAFFRDKTLNVASEHTAFSSMELINSAITNKGFRKTSEEETLLNYSIPSLELDKFENVLVANKVVINYSTYSIPSFIYNNETKLYTRYYKGVKQTDYLTKADMTAKNIIVYKVKNYLIDSYRQGLENIGSGEGYYISEGYAIPITWEKASRSSKTIYKYQNGEELIVNDGNTYIQIMPINKELIISQS